MGSQNGPKGKRYKPRLYDITFPETSAFADLEAKVKGASLDTFLELMAVADLAQDAADGVTVTPAHRQAVETLVREFSKLVHWWNADDENGDPVTPDEAGLRSQDFVMVMALFNAWSERFAAVAPPLQDGSGPGPAEPDLAEIPVVTEPASPSS